MCLSIFWALTTFFAGAAIGMVILTALAISASMSAYDDRRNDAWRDA